MSRIRSVHPGLFTDDKFAAVSLGAKVLFIGIWTECDDQGAFEWNPVKLKLRVLPFDNVDITSLLAELADADMVKAYSHGGRKLGAVRNFTRFQRPKKPNSVYFMPPEFRTYAGLTADSSEPPAVEAMPVPKKAEKSPQMEGREEEGRKEQLNSSLRSERAREFEREFSETFWPAYPNKVGKPKAFKAFVAARKFAAMPAIMAGLSRYVDAKPHDRQWLNPATFLNQERWADQPAASDAKPPVNGNGSHPFDPGNEQDAMIALAIGREQLRWHRGKWGPMPGEDGCLISPSLLRPGDGQNWREWNDA